MPPPAQGAIPGQTGNSRTIVRFVAEPVIVEAGDRCIVNGRWIESVQRRASRVDNARRLKLEPRLERGHFPRLRRSVPAVEALQRLPAEHRKLMVVPHTHEGPTCARILNVVVVQVGAVDGAIVLDGRWDVKDTEHGILDLL